MADTNMDPRNLLRGKLIGQTSPEDVVTKLLDHVRAKEKLPAGENKIILEGRLDNRYYGVNGDKLDYIDVHCEEFAKERLTEILGILDEKNVRITIEILE